MVVDSRSASQPMLGVLPMNSVLEHTALQIYAEAAEFFGQLSPRYGYKILYGPPHHQAPILFIGYQPGGDAPEANETDCWPSVYQYATENWPLTRVMWKLFDKEFLKQCCGLNGIFVRAPSSDVYRREYREARYSIEKFCLERVGRLVNAINPQKIVVIGFAALELFGGSKEFVKNSNGRVLMKKGQIAGRPAIATMHLSGAQISTPDLNAIGAELRGAVS
jgi:hypothetical protein